MSSVNQGDNPAEETLEKVTLSVPSSIPSSAPNSPKSALASRFAFVDGLRGIAALSILIFHLWWYEPKPWPTLASFPPIVDATLMKLRGGVQILLVISGFVIAYTLRKTWFTGPEVVSFVGRRLVRLIPAYWMVLLAVILLDLVCRHLLSLPSPMDGHLTATRIVAHLAFLQDVADVGALSAGIWTLCIEMQFYVVAILGWGLAQRLFRRPDPDFPQPSPWGLLIVFGPLALASLFHWRTMESTSPWVTHFLWMFFLGMCTWWTLDRTVPRLVLLSLVVIAIVELYLDPEWRYENSMALLTALVIYVAGRMNALHVWLNWGPLQYLGRISYSLYLIHFPVCHLIVSAGWKACGNSPTQFQSQMIHLVAIAASLVAGHLLYILVEAPSARWAARLKRPEST